MTPQWTVPAWLAVGTLVVLVALAAGVLLLARRVADVRARMTRLEQLAGADSGAPAPVAPTRAPAAPTPDPVATAPAGYVITRLGEGPDGVAEPSGPVAGGRSREPVTGTVRAAPFADAVLRETVVASASLLHGVRRALAPEARNRARFAMRQEVKRARRQRRADLRAARRDWQDRRGTRAPREGTAA